MSEKHPAAGCTAASAVHPAGTRRTACIRRTRRGTPKKKWAAVTALVLGIISALTGIFVIGSFLTIPTIIFAVIALVMVKNGTGKGKSMAITALVLVLVAYIATFAFFRFVPQTLKSLT